MKRLAFVAAGLLLLLAVGLVTLRLAGEGAPAREVVQALAAPGKVVAPPPGPASLPQAIEAKEVAVGDSSPEPSPTPAPPPRSLTPAEEGDRAMAKALGLHKPRSSFIGEQLARYTPDELQLRATLERRTRAPVPPALDRLLQMRKAGASARDLQAFVDRELANPPEVREIVLGWLAAQG